MMVALKFAEIDSVSFSRRRKGRLTVVMFSLADDPLKMLMDASFNCCLNSKLLLFSPLEHRKWPVRSRQPVKVPWLRLTLDRTDTSGQANLPVVKPHPEARRRLVMSRNLVAIGQVCMDHVISLAFY